MEDNRLKQRLVGAIVLVALGVIFIPMLLSSDPPGVGMLATNIPPERVVLDSTPIEVVAPPHSAPEPLPARPVPLDLADLLPTQPNPPVQESVAADAKMQPSPTSESVAAAPAGDSAAWVVQLASFTQEANALALKDKLLARRHHAYVEAVEANGSTLYRVRVGPEVRRQSAERLRDQLKRETRLEGLVLAHP